MPNTMASEADAKRLIESIRDDCGLNSQNDMLITQFDRMIEMQVTNFFDLFPYIWLSLTVSFRFSSQLYDTSTHFLLELLQNVDDNVYNCPKPQVKFSYEPGQLRVDCNEVGFNAANVRAISAIGASTKSGQNKTDGFTGEKGIGFKSVFKVADVVWVASGPYKFKFDKRKRLGMIAPIWADFPGPLIPGHTSFYLQFTRDYDQDELLQDLKDFDPDRVLFLRRIKAIELNVQQSNGESWAAKLDRTVSPDHERPMTVIRRGSHQFSYHVMKHKVGALPADDKRPGFSTTELQLAFPVFDTSRGIRPNQKPKNVYAYLPIGDYGLKVFLHVSVPKPQTDRFISSYYREISCSQRVASILTPPHYGIRLLEMRWVMHFFMLSRSSTRGMKSSIGPATYRTTGRPLFSNLHKNAYGNP